MKPLPHIVLASEESGFAEKLEQALHSKHVRVSGICRGLTELRAHLECAKPPVVIVDIDGDPQGVLGELDELVPLYPQTRFAVASSTSSRNLILEAMQAGARHFMHKKSIDVELDRVLERLLVDSARASLDLGSIVTVFSAGGGCGATTVALNLANELRLKSSQSVLVIDLDGCYGAVSSYLGVHGNYGIVDVLRQKERIDDQFITSSATSYEDGFDVLVGPGSFSGLSDGNGQFPNLAEALEACRAAYKYTVIDAPRVSKRTMQLLAGASKTVLVVLQSNVKDIKVAKSMISVLREFGIAPEKVLPLVNRFRRTGRGVPLNEVKKAIGSECLYRVRNDFKRITNSINHAKPLSESASRSAIRRDFCGLAENICIRLDNGDAKTSG